MDDIVGLALCLVVAAATWGIFVKAGRAGWLALVPFYDVVVLFQIAGRPAWHALVLMGLLVARVLVDALLAFSGGEMIVSFVLVLGAAGLWFSVCVALAARFDRGVPFAIGMMIVPFVFYPVLAFGPAQYDGESSEVRETLGLT